MNKKAFVLSETLVMSSVVIILLMVCYYPFSSIIDNKQQFNKYDNIEDIYKLNNVRQFIYKYIGTANIINAMEKESKNIVPLSGNQLNIENDNTEKADEIKKRYLDLLNLLNIKNVYFAKYNLNESTINSLSISYELKEYLLYINNSKATAEGGGSITNTYRLIAVFDNSNNNKTYSSIKIWSDEDDE